MTEQTSLFSVDGYTDCKACSLYKSCKSPNIKPAGPDTSPILLIGEAPGHEEDIANSPFIGRSGEELNNALRAAGLSRDSILITNTCRCYPKQNSNKKPSNQQWKKCVKTHLLPLISRVRPKIIVTVGGYALEALTGLKGIMHRQNVAFKSLRYNCLILPVIHPAKILRGGNEDDRKSFIEGICKIRKLLKTGEPEFDYGDYHTISDLAKLDSLYRYVQDRKYFCFDIECLSLDIRNKENKLTSFSFAVQERESFILPFLDMEDRDKTYAIKWLRSILQDKTINKIAQNMKFDSGYMKGQFGIDTENWHSDTMLAHFLLDETKKRHGLSSMTWKYIPRLGGYDSTVEASGGAGHVVDGNILYQYNAADVDATFRLHNIFMRMLGRENQLFLYHNILMPAARELFNMEFYGVKFDKEYIEKLNSKYLETLTKMEFKMNSLEGVKKTVEKFNTDFNPRSKTMIQHLLFDYYKLPVLSRTEKAKEPQVNKDNIKIYAEKHKNPYCILLSHYRRIDKLRSTYLEGMLKIIPEDEIIHPEFHLHMTATGRSSSDSPNLQNIPRQKDIKSMITAREGCQLLAVDFAQAEVRVSAMVSGDEKLIAVCNDVKKDFHTNMASVAFNVPYDKVTADQRQAAKSVSFGVLYGIGPLALSKQIGKSKEQAQKIIDDYFQTYLTLTEWIYETKHFLRKNHYVTSPFGRRRRFPDFFRYEDSERAEAEREAVNAIIQSTSSDFMLITLVRISERLREMKSKPCIEVHDSVIINLFPDEFDQVSAIVKEEVGNCTSGFDWAERVTMRGDLEIGYRWGEVEKI